MGELDAFENEVGTFMGTILEVVSDEFAKKPAEKILAWLDGVATELREPFGFLLFDDEHLISGIGSPKEFSTEPEAIVGHLFDVDMKIRRKSEALKHSAQAVSLDDEATRVQGLAKGGAEFFISKMVQKTALVEVQEVVEVNVSGIQARR